MTDNIDQSEPKDQPFAAAEDVTDSCFGGFLILISISAGLFGLFFLSVIIVF